MKPHFDCSSWKEEMETKRWTKLGQSIIDAACDWHANNSASQYNIGDCCSSVSLDAIYAALGNKTPHQIDGAIAALQRNGFLMTHDDEPDNIRVRHVRLDHPSWLAWSKWKWEYLDDILGTEVGQDWGW